MSMNKYKIRFEITVEGFITPNPKELNDLLEKTVDEYLKKEGISYDAGIYIDREYVLPNY